MSRARELSELATAYDSGGGFGFRNRIINGDMRIDQRNAGASFTSSGNQYCLDRWLLQAVGATNTAQQVTGSTGNNKAVRITGNTGNTLTGFSQRIESWNILDCASQSVTVSFTLSGSASGSVSVRRLYPTATDNYTSITEPDSGVTVNFTTTATRYTATFTLSSNANKGLWLYFDFGAVGSGVTRTLEDIQLEAGSVASPFERRDYGRELIMCCRYYEQINVPSGQIPIAPIPSGAAYLACVVGSLQVTKRATPTMALLFSLTDANYVGGTPTSTGKWSFGNGGNWVGKSSGTFSVGMLSAQTNSVSLSVGSAVLGSVATLLGFHADDYNKPFISASSEL